MLTGTFERPERSGPGDPRGSHTGPLLLALGKLVNQSIRKGWWEVGRVKFEVC